MKNFFTGPITALITPFLNGAIDVFALERLLQAQLDANVSGIVLFGTTGEGISLSESEKKLLFFTAKEIIKNKIPIICGCSSPTTKKAVRQSVQYSNWGADAILLSSPYYYHCLNDGVILHFKETAKAIDCPIIAYNVPYRTGCNIMQPEILDQLKQMDVIAVKDAQGDLDIALNSLKNSPLPIFCGNDSNCYQLLENGAIGSINVASNVAPKAMVKLHQLATANNSSGASYPRDKLTKLFNLLSAEPNPIPVKFFAAIKYSFSYEVRLPLTPPSRCLQEEIRNYLSKEVIT